MNDSGVFDRKITLDQKESGIFSFLLPMLASTIIPSLISKGKGVSKNYFFKVKINTLHYLKEKTILHLMFL